MSSLECASAFRSFRYINISLDGAGGRYSLAPPPATFYPLCRISHLQLQWRVGEPSPLYRRRRRRRRHRRRRRRRRRQRQRRRTAVVAVIPTPTSALIAPIVYLWRAIAISRRKFCFSFLLHDFTVGARRRPANTWSVFFSYNTPIFFPLLLLLLWDA